MASHPPGSSRNAGVWSAVSNCTPRALRPSGMRTRTCCAPTGIELPERALHHHRVGQVHQVHRHRLLLPPDRHVQHARARHRHRRLLVGRPLHGVAQQLAVIRRTALPRTCGRCPTGSRRRARADLAQVDLAAYRSAARAGRPSSIGRSGIGRDQRQRRAGESPASASPRRGARR